MCVCVVKCMDVCLCKCVCVLWNVLMYDCVNVCMCMWQSMCVYMYERVHVILCKKVYVYMCIYIYIHINPPISTHIYISLHILHEISKNSMALENSHLNKSATTNSFQDDTNQIQEIKQINKHHQLKQTNTNRQNSPNQLTPPWTASTRPAKITVPKPRNILRKFWERSCCQEGPQAVSTGLGAFHLPYIRP